MSHPVLQRAQWRAGGGHARAERVAQLVEGDLVDLGALERLLEAPDARPGVRTMLPGVAPRGVSLQGFCCPAGSNLRTLGLASPALCRTARIIRFPGRLNPAA